MDKDIKDRVIIVTIALGWLIGSVVVYSYDNRVGYMLLAVLVLAFIAGFSGVRNKKEIGNEMS